MGALVFKSDKLFYIILEPALCPQIPEDFLSRAGGPGVGIDALVSKGRTVLG